MLMVHYRDYDQQYWMTVDHATV